MHLACAGPAYPQPLTPSMRAASEGIPPTWRGVRMGFPRFPPDRSAGAV